MKLVYLHVANLLKSPANNLIHCPDTMAGMLLETVSLY